MRTSLSKLIREEEYTLLQVNDFEEEDLGLSLPEEAPEGLESCITLPIMGDCSLQGKRREEESGGEEDLEEVEDRLARLEREAYEKGFAQGQKDGLTLETRQMEQRAGELDALFSGLEGLKAGIARETEGELLKLSLLIARRIIRGEVKTDPHVIGRTLKAALEFVTDRSAMMIMIHPEDMEEVRRLLPEIASRTKGGNFEVVEDHSIGRGGCVLKTGFGNVNATLEDQLEIVEREIEKEFEGLSGESR